MKLIDLEPRFLRVAGPGRNEVVARFDEAQGVEFWCPCGKHGVLVWFAGRGAPADEWPMPRWTASGTGISDLSLSPSINFTSGCWHGFVTNGEVTSV